MSRRRRQEPQNRFRGPRRGGLGGDRRGERDGVAGEGPCQREWPLSELAELGILAGFEAANADLGAARAVGNVSDGIGAGRPPWRPVAPPPIRKLTALAPIRRGQPQV